MYEILFENKFKKDYKLAVKRGLKISLLEEVLKLLREEGKLPSKFKAHLLKGNYKGY
jgi:mRNA interferase YafQ